MSNQHTPACDEYLAAAQSDPQFAAMVAEFLPMSDAEIRDRILTYRDDDLGTPVGDFMRRLWPLLTNGTATDGYLDHLCWSRGPRDRPYCFRAFGHLGQHFSHPEFGFVERWGGPLDRASDAERREAVLPSDIRARLTEGVW